LPPCPVPGLTIRHAQIIDFALRDARTLVKAAWMD
jgi:hypothetical protein